MTKISDFIRELEKIKDEHGDLPVVVRRYDEHAELYYLGEADYPQYHKHESIYHDGEEECVIVGD